jgi:prefoldin subunit 5
MLWESLRMLINAGRARSEDVVNLEKRVDENSKRIARAEHEIERLDRHIELFAALNRKRVEEQERRDAIR